MKSQLIIIRGVSGSGKSTISEELRRFFPKKKTAVIHTSIFYHQIVSGDSPEVAMENTRRILDNYLKNKYTVILEGTLSFKNKKGMLYLQELLKVAKKYCVPVKKFFFKTDFEELRKRENKRKKISLNLLKKIHNLALNSRKRDEIIINTTNKTIPQILSIIQKDL